MGIFDWVKVEPPIKCPKCGRELSGWQTQDGIPYMVTVDFRQVRTFYTSCDACGMDVECTRKPATSIDDFIIEVE